MKRNPVQYQKGVSLAAFLRRCGSGRHCRLRSRRLWKCDSCRRQSSPVAGTIFAAINLPLTVQFLAIRLLPQGEHGVASMKLARQLGMSRHTAYKASPSSCSC